MKLNRLGEALLPYLIVGEIIMHYTTGKFAKKAGVTERTLRYYDKIGLLKPKKNDENSYRLYTDEDFVLLQKILVFKSLGFSLDEIRFLIHDNNEIEKSFDVQKKLIKQKITYYTKVYDSLNYTSRLLKNDANALDHLVETVRLLSKQDSLAEQYKNANNLNVRIELHEKYSTNPIKWFDWLYENIDFSKINTLLEVGCGNGQLWMNKRKDIRNREIFLTDVSDGMLEDAKQNLNDNFSFFVVNCENIPFKKDFFDAIIANHVLFYLNDLNQGLSEIRRVLKKNGIFYSTTYSKNHMREINELVKEFNSNVYLSEQPLYHRFGLENGEMLLKQYFKNVECKIYKDYLDIDDAKPIVNYILSCHGNQDVLLEKYDEFYDFVENKIKEKGFIRITKEACLFICENG